MRSRLCRKFGLISLLCRLRSRLCRLACISRRGLCLSGRLQRGILCIIGIRSSLCRLLCGLFGVRDGLFGCLHGLSYGVDRIRGCLQGCLQVVFHLRQRRFFLCNVVIKSGSRIDCRSLQLVLFLARQVREVQLQNVERQQVLPRRAALVLPLYIVPFLAQHWLFPVLCQREADVEHGINRRAALDYRRCGTVRDGVELNRDVRRRPDVSLQLRHVGPRVPSRALVYAKDIEVRYIANQGQLGDFCFAKCHIPCLYILDFPLCCLP